MNNAKRAQLYRLHEAYQKHNPAPLFTVFKKKEDLTAVILACGCGAKLCFTPLGNYGRPVDTDCFTSFSCRNPNEGWLHILLPAIAANPTAKKAYGRLKYESESADPAYLKALRAAERQYGLRP